MNKRGAARLLEEQIPHDAQTVKLLNLADLDNGCIVMIAQINSTVNERWGRRRDSHGADDKSTIWILLIIPVIFLLNNEAVRRGSWRRTESVVRL
jgi:hypothetical protein